MLNLLEDILAVIQDGAQITLRRDETRYVTWLVVEVKKTFSDGTTKTGQHQVPFVDLGSRASLGLLIRSCYENLKGFHEKEKEL